jgi:hypothetical protein
MEPGARETSGIGDPENELRVILPILPVVSCFSLFRFGEGFASCWLWDPMGAFWGPLIFLFQCS